MRWGDGTRIFFGKGGHIERVIWKKCIRAIIIISRSGKPGKAATQAILELYCCLTHNNELGNLSLFKE